MMKRSIWASGAVCALLMVALASAQGPAKKDDKKKEPAPLRVKVERDDATYKVDESASFVFVSTVAGEVGYRFTEDGYQVVKEGKLKVEAGQTYRLEGKLDRPGFLRLELKQGTATALAAAAIDPTKIEPTAKMPADFDEFWAGQLKELAKVGMEVEKEPVESKSTSTVDSYRLKIAGVEGKSVRGWLSMPKGPGPFPVVLTVPGAGVYGIGPDHHHANLGAISINIIIHDIQVDAKDPDYYKSKSTTELKAYTSRGWDDKTKTYFRYAILGGIRALDYATSLKEFNGKEVAVTGGSQGGALTLILSGLDKRVGFAAPNIAGMCDLNGRAHKRIDGWPHWLAVAPAELKAKIEETSGYYDAVNFARKFRGKSVHGVGFLDSTCPPTTAYAAFNVHPEPKKMIDSPLMAHATDPRWTKARDEFWKANLSLKPAPK